MSDKKISETNKTDKKENKYNERQFIVGEKYIINNKSAQYLIPSEKSLNKKFVLKLKQNYPLKNLNPHYFNKSNNKIIINNDIRALRNYNNLYIGNYKSIINSPIAQKNNLYSYSSKFKDNILLLNNSHDNKPKFILPNINIKNKRDSLILKKEKSVINRNKMKEIFLGDLLKEEINDDIIPKKRRYLKTKNNHAKSEWNLVTEKERENKNNDNIILEELLFNKNLKSCDIKIEINNKYKNITEIYKSGAQRLEEIHKQKLINNSKLIKKMEKETNDKKKFINKCFLLMRKNFENSEKFNTKFI